MKYSLVLCVLLSVPAFAQIPCTANQVVAAPNGSTGYPGCRALVTADLPGGLASAWSAITNPSANVSFGMAAYTTTFTYGAATGSSDLYGFTDTASNTGTGILLHPHTASGSSETPFQADVNGVGWKVDPSTGALESVGASGASLNIKFGGGTSGYWNLTVNNIAGSGTAIGEDLAQFLGTVTTSGSTTETFSNAYITSSSHCQAQPNNGTAALPVYFSGYSTGSVTLNNSSTSGMGYDIWCAAD